MSDAKLELLTLAEGLLTSSDRADVDVPRALALVELHREYRLSAGRGDEPEAKKESPKKKPTKPAREGAHMTTIRGDYRNGQRNADAAAGVDTSAEWES